MPPCSGPGRYSAMMALMSRVLSGRVCVRSARMPSDSSWNTPLASPLRHHGVALHRGALFQGVGDGDAEPLGPPGVQVVDARERHVEGAADGLERRLVRRRAERGDLRRPRLAVLLLDVGEHLLAAVLAEVDV